MAGKPCPPELIKQAVEAYIESGCNVSAAARLVGTNRSTMQSRLNIAQREGYEFPSGQGRTKRYRDSVKQKRKQAVKSSKSEEDVKIREKGDSLSIEYKGTLVQTPEQLIESCEIDLDIWEVCEITTNSWEVAGRINTGEELVEKGGKVFKLQKPQQLWKSPLRQIKVRFKRKSDEKMALEALIEQISQDAPVAKLIKRPQLKSSKNKRMLEVCIMDPHYGLNCFKPSSDQRWSLEECEELCMWAIEDLVTKSKVHGPFEQIIFPFGNDYMHHDNMKHETTNGTSQPEGVSWHHVFERAEVLAINMVERLKEEANVKVISVPGNHDHQSAYTLARILKAWYRNDPNVEVDASSSPYKFHRYGTTLLGFEHGHSISGARLPGLMANERPSDWSETTYREWHLGDQHRKATGKPSFFEEQGVSVEYLPALTPPNQWHRLKAFNWQKRGAMAYVWDYHTGAEARFQSNLNSYTGRPFK